MDQLPFKSPSGTTIARGQPKDVPDIQKIVKAAYAKYTERIGKEPAPMTADYLQLLSSHDVFVLHAHANTTSTTDSHQTTQLVGSIVVRPDTQAKVLYVNNLVVDPAAQGRGYGRVLLACAEDWAAANGCSSLALYTNVKMFENFGLYAKMGFEETERKWQDGYERVFFRKELQQTGH